MTKIVRIDPDGTITDVPGRDLLGAATAELGPVDVCTLSNPILGTRPWPPYVACCGEWSRTNGGATNWKAWALYGRSELCGAVFLAYDQDDNGDRPDLSDDLLTVIRGELVEWCPEMAAIRDGANR